MPAATAKAHWLKELRLQSLGADLESNIDATLDYLKALPSGSNPDFNTITPIHSNEYRGNVTISGTDTKHWSVIVRDRQDGRSEFFDGSTGTGTGTGTGTNYYL